MGEKQKDVTVTIALYRNKSYNKRQKTRTSWMESGAMVRLILSSKLFPPGIRPMIISENCIITKIMVSGNTGLWIHAERL